MRNRACHARPRPSVAPQVDSASFLRYPNALGELDQPRVRALLLRSISGAMDRPQTSKPPLFRSGRPASLFSSTTTSSFPSLTLTPQSLMLANTLLPLALSLLSLLTSSLAAPTTPDFLTTSLISRSSNSAATSVLAASDITQIGHWANFVSYAAPASLCEALLPPSRLTSFPEQCCVLSLHHRGLDLRCEVRLTARCRDDLSRRRHRDQTPLVRRLITI